MQLLTETLEEKQGSHLWFPLVLNNTFYCYSRILVIDFQIILIIIVIISFLIRLFILLFFLIIFIHRKFIAIFNCFKKDLYRLENQFSCFKRFCIIKGNSVHENKLNKHKTMYLISQQGKMSPNDGLSNPEKLTKRV